MPQWILDSMQYLHLAVFAVVCISVEWRRPGLVLAGFALLYLAMALPVFNGISFNAFLRETDSPTFMRVWIVLDMLGAAMIFSLCKPGKNNTKYRTGRWLAITGLLIAFWVAHFLNFNYTMGYAVALPTPVYDMVTVVLALLTPVIVWPGIKDGFYEGKQMALEKLAGRRLPSYQLHKVSDTERNSGTVSQSGNVLRRSDTTLVMDHGGITVDSRKE